MTVETFTTSGSWVCPPGVTSVDVEAWGSGSDGGAGMAFGSQGWGGGGGAYAKKSGIAVVPGNTYAVNVGDPMRYGTWPNDSSFIDDATLLAKGAVTTTGGNASDCVGDVVYSGGNGAIGSMTASGGGGSSAGSGSNGNSGSGTSGGAEPIGGFKGGNGHSAPMNGVAGFGVGAGGGGGNGAGKTGGICGKGLVKVTY